MYFSPIILLGNLCSVFLGILWMLVALEHYIMICSSFFLIKAGIYSSGILLQFSLIPRVWRISRFSKTDPYFHFANVREIVLFGKSIVLRCYVMNIEVFLFYLLKLLEALLKFTLSLMITFRELPPVPSIFYCLTSWSLRAVMSSSSWSG